MTAKHFFLILASFVLVVTGALAVFGAILPLKIVGLPFGLIFLILAIYYRNEEGETPHKAFRRSGILVADRKRRLRDLALHYGNELAEDPDGEGTEFDKAIIDALVKVKAKFAPDSNQIAAVLSEENLNA